MVEILERSHTEVTLGAYVFQRVNKVKEGFFLHHHKQVERLKKAKKTDLFKLPKFGKVFFMIYYDIVT
jgi:hypothetical protein